MLVGRCVPNNNWSSALIGRCALISRPDSTVGGKLTNHSYLLAGYFRGTRVCLLFLAAIFASMRISIILLRCFHLRTFKTSVHIIRQMQKPRLAAYIIVFDGKMRTLTPINATVPRQVAFTSVSKEPVSYWCVLIFLKIPNYCMFSYATMWNDGIKCWERKETNIPKHAGKYDRFGGCCYVTSGMGVGSARQSSKTRGFYLRIYKCFGILPR